MKTQLQVELEAAMVPKALRNPVRVGSRKCVVSGLLFVLGVFLTVIRTGQADTGTGPIRLHPDNRHYFLYQGRPTVLITSAEHYGAVINKDFDYAAYLGTLKAYGLNYTRIYPGVLYEPQGKFMKGNTLGPRPGSLSVPWARSAAPASNLCGNKFDLDQWDSEYFARLKDFIAKAREGGIVVEICFFNSQYSDTWPISPLYWENNIQGVGKCDYTDAQTLKHPDLVKRMEDYVRKIAEEVNGFDNVILEICDEPSLFTPVEQAGPWVRHLVHFLFEAESRLPKHHLIAQQVEGPLAIGVTTPIGEQAAE